MAIKLEENHLKDIETCIHNITIRVGDLLKTTRKESGLTISKLTELSHVSSTVITDLENGRSLPRTEVLLKLAYALEIPYSKLFNEFVPGITDFIVEKPKRGIPTLEQMIKYVGLVGIDAKEVMSFIEFKKFQNQNRK